MKRNAEKEAIQKGFQLYDKIKFEKEKNPRILLRVFTIARQYSLTPPDWVLDELYKAFTSYLSANGKTTLDKAMGLTRTRGKPPAWVEEKNSIWDFVYMQEIYTIRIYFGLPIDETVRMVTGWLSYCPVADETLADKYIRQHWEEQFNNNEHGVLVHLIDQSNEQKMKYLKNFPKDFIFPGKIQAFIEQQKKNKLYLKR